MASQPRSPLHVEPTTHSRLADEGYEARISKTVICARCGYNLKGLPYVARCVECNAEYNARRAMGANIYRPGTAEFPWRSVIALALLGMAGLFLAPTIRSMGRLALLPFANLTVFLFAVTAIGVVVVSIRLLRELLPYWRFRRWERFHAESIAEDAAVRAQGAGDAASAEAAAYPVSFPPVKLDSDRLATAGYEVTVNWSAICAGCGYVLRGLPFVGVCPECGSHYCARLTRLKNVICPNDVSLPWSDIWAAVLSAATAGLLVLSFSARGFAVLLLLALLFAAGAVTFAAIAWRKSRRYTMVRRVIEDLEGADTGEE